MAIWSITDQHSVADSLLAQSEQERKKRCDSIVAQLHEIEILANTGIYRGTQWVDLEYGTETTTGFTNIDNIAVALKDALFEEAVGLVDFGLSMANPTYGYLSSVGAFSDSFGQGDFVSASVQLTGAVSGGIQTADTHNKLYNGSSALTKSGSALLKRAGWVGVTYTAGSVGYSAFQHYESDPIITTTRELTPIERSQRLDWLRETTVNPMREAAVKAYNDNNCADFY
jgi:hypothetical protein